MLPARTLQVLAACAAVVSSAPSLALAQAPRAAPGAQQRAVPSAYASAYEVLRMRLKATRVDSPDQVRSLRASLAGHAVELAGRVAGVMSNRRGSLILLQCIDNLGQPQTLTLEVPPALAADAASMRALRANAAVRVLATVSAEGTEPMLVPVAATTDAAPAPLFREQEGQEGDMVIMSPVNGALPLPRLNPQTPPGGTSANADGSAGTDANAGTGAAPDAFSSLPRARVPSVRAARPAPRLRRSAPAPRGWLAPPAPSVASEAPAPVEPSVRAWAQQRARRGLASRGGQPSSRSAQAREQAQAEAQAEAQAQAEASDPALFSDDERVQAQLPAYENLVRRFNKKLSPAQAEEIARGLLTAGYSQNMDPRFLAAIIAVESDFDIYCLSSSGAMGLGQLMPFNLPEVGMQKADAWNPTKNILGTAMLLRGHLNDFKSRPNGTLLAVAAYNAGPNAVKRAGYKVPPGAQVQRYVWKVYYRYKEFAPELFR